MRAAAKLTLLCWPPLKFLTNLKGIKSLATQNGYIQSRPRTFQHSEVGANSKETRFYRRHRRFAFRKSSRSRWVSLWWWIHRTKQFPGACNLSLVLERLSLSIPVVHPTPRFHLNSVSVFRRCTKAESFCHSLMHPAVHIWGDKVAV